MPDMVRDGTGHGHLARVNLNNELLVRSTAMEERLTAALSGIYFETTTSTITLLNDVETPILYLYNGCTTGRFNVIDRVFVDTWASVGGAGNGGTLVYYRNPEITGGTPAATYNTLFDNARIPPGQYLSSPTTMTGDRLWTGYLSDQAAVAIEEGRIVIPAGRSIGFAVAAPTGNTNMNIAINVGFYRFYPPEIFGE